MTTRLIVLDAISVLAGAVIALFVVDVIAWIFLGTAIAGMVASLGRWVIILLTVALFAVYYRVLPTTAAALASFFTGVVLPLVAEKLIFGSSLPTTSLLFLYVVFAVVALFVYRFVRAGAPARGMAERVTTPGDGQS
ncbi:hypothetical protein [Aurantimonas sp. VKM B-3413]|uniref:hypothetical protein n=1 Tax=Aurantimonas sp. VKM B-3413 TaxID=2779401 RepID=UPI001E33EEF0|nr:hypothetical protein [Aurantimonas sp. VKM B-3413]MCB8840737.1 hypothetical protein [Aurantimonas sp. VKM B-3413]